LRNELVAAIVGVVVGHALWLIAISLAIDTTTISSWVLIVAAASVLLGVIGIVLGLRHYRRKSYVWAAFLWCLPLSPAVFSLAVLGVTYL
jgi:predicted lysophospholipase L1 biosynthesis ABC-type transport system permease subunit